MFELKRGPNMRINKTLLLLIVFMSSGCASLKNKTLMAGLASFVPCSIIGAVSAPKDERGEMHGALSGSACAAAGMAISEIFFEKKNEIKNLEQHHMNSMNNLKNEAIESVYKSSSYKQFSKKTKDKLQGNWKLYESKQWEENTDGSLKFNSYIIRF